jgi:tape measure domain-containing protein
MSEAIKRSDVADKDLYGNVIEGAKIAFISAEKLNEELRKTAKLSKEAMAKNSRASKASEIRELEKQIKVSNETKKKAIKLDIEMQRLTTQKMRAERLYKTEVERTTKAEQKQTQAIKDQSNAYKILVKETRDEKNESKRLGAEMLKLEKTTGKNTKEYRTLEKQYRRTTKSARSLDKQLKKLDSNVGDNFRNVGRYQKAIGGLRNGLAQLGLAFGVFQGARFLFETETRLQSLQLALKNVVGTNEQYAKSTAFISKLSKDFGQDLLVLTGSYKNFIASSESSNLSMEEREKIFQAVIKSGSSLALTNDQIEGSLLAVSQMFSKGTVSAEELRGQLGERLPGAFGIMAKSIGVSEAELGKMMQRGEVMAADVLPKFAVELEKTFGKNAEKNLTTIGGAFNVLKTEITETVNEFNSGNKITEKFAAVLLFLGRNLGTIISFIGKAVVALTAYKAIQIAVRIQQTLLNKEVLKSIFSFKGLGKAVKTSSGEVSKMGGALRSVGFAVAIGLAIELAQGFFDIATGADKARAATERFNEAVSQGAKFGDDLIEAARKEIKLENQKNELALSGGKIKKAEFEARKKEILENAQRFIRVNIQQANAEKKRDGASKARIAEQNEILKRLFDLRAELNDQIVENTIATNNETNSTKSSNKATKEKAESINDLVAEYERWRDARVALSRTEDTEREAIDKSLITNADEAIKQRRRNIAEIKVLNAEMFGSEQDLLDARIEQIRENLAIELEDIEKSETEKEKLRLQAQKDILDIQNNNDKKRFENQKEWIDATADYFIKRSEEKIDQIDKEIDAAQNQFDHLQELAANGNIAAEQSLKEQQRLINEANQKKIAEQKRIERIKLAETALTVYSEKVEAGDETPLASTITEIALIRAFIDALPSFDVGADRLDSKGQNIDGKGGFLAINHPDEQILTADQNQRTGFMPAEEKTKIVESYLSGNLVNLKSDGATQVGKSWDIAPLLSKLDSVENAINNIETSSVDVQGLTNSWLTIVNKVKKGNKTTTNTFKTRYDT